MNKGDSDQDIPPDAFLSDLISQLPINLGPFSSTTIPDVTINGVVSDSRMVKSGNLFVAVKGEGTDGHLYIMDAIQRGANSVVGTQAVSDLSVPYVQVKDSRLAVAYLSAAFYGFPARKLVMIGVTGTDGKTTTASLISHILKTAGFQVGMISTICAQINDQILDTGFHVTTPEAPDIQRYLYQMAASGITHVILEATSHGLSQDRVAACDFDIGVVTNITHEHLDYHGTYEAYRSAKGRLFASLGSTSPKPINPPQGAVLNKDDNSFDYLARITKVKCLTYGQDSAADLQAEEVESFEDRLRFIVSGRTLHGRQVFLPLSCNIPGIFNVSNCLASFAVTAGVIGLEDQDVIKGFASMQVIPGRMERIDLGQDFTVMVDFAHTPNALRSVLKSARKLTSGCVIALFGSAGLRDREKRSLMAEISADLADFTILTAEDPRTESLSAILSEMADGVKACGGVEGKSFWRISDRREAIRFALQLARPGDLVIACGKGHEQSMCFGEKEYPWDDRIAMRAALAEHLGLVGPQMPFLPSQD